MKLIPVHTFEENYNEVPSELLPPQSFSKARQTFLASRNLASTAVTAGLSRHHRHESKAAFRGRQNTV